MGVGSEAAMNTDTKPVRPERSNASGTPFNSGTGPFSLEQAERLADWLENHGYEVAGIAHSEAGFSVFVRDGR